MEFCDAHNDILHVTRNEEELKKYFDKQKKNNAKKIFCAYYSQNDDANVNINNITYCFNLIKKISDIAIPTIENSWFLTPENLEEFIKLKPFCCTLTHTKSNNLCGDAFDDNGFTDWGKEVVKIFEQNDILVDTAHMGEKSFFEFADMTTKPIFNSHCGFDFEFVYPRNLSNEQIKIIEESKGYIGLAFYPKFFNKSINSKTLADTIIKFCDNYDYKILGLGTDFNGIQMYPEDIKDYNDLIKVENELLNKGLNKTIVERIFSINLLDKINKNKYYANA